MIDKLKKIADELKNIEEEMINPDIISDQKKYISLGKKSSELRPIVELYNEYSKYLNQKEEALELLKDPDMKELADIDLEDAKKRIPEIEEKIRFAMLPRDPNDNKNIIIEIRAAAGGDEASIFAGEVGRMYLRYAEENNFKSEIITKQDAEPDGVKYFSFKISGEGTYSKFKYESGVHRVQRIPVTESQGRVHTSTITVAVMPEADEVDAIIIRPDEIKFDTFRAQGAGGQHVNTTDSAVRVTHLPTGIVVECQDGRSQHKNKEQAMKVLSSRILAAQIEKQQKEQKDIRFSQIGTGDRSEKIRTYNFPQDRVTDHRIKQSWNNIQGVMDGNIGQIFEKLSFEDRAKKLANFS